MATSSTLDDTINYRVTPFGRTVHAVPGWDVPDHVGRFRVLGELARGGMGIVLRAYDESLDREVAVKLAAPDAGPQFGHEPRVLGRFHHPGIIAVHEAGTLPDGRGYFAMPLVEGQTLSAGLAGRLTPATDLRSWLDIFEKTCRAVEHAHARGVVHRDLKPSNVMVCGDGRVYVLDWGVACDAGAADEPGSGVCGTPAYMAPEQFKTSAADPRADVFGLGAILCEILTGDAPYVGLIPAAVTIRATDADQAELRARLAACPAPSAVVSLAGDCLWPDAGGRPTDAGEVANRLAAALADLDRPVVTPAAATAEPKVSGIFAATALTIACVMAAATVSKLRAHYPPPVPATAGPGITTG